MRPIWVLYGHARMGLPIGAPYTIVCWGESCATNVAVLRPVPLYTIRTHHTVVHGFHIWSDDLILSAMPEIYDRSREPRYSTTHHPSLSGVSGSYGEWHNHTYRSDVTTDTPTCIDEFVTPTTRCIVGCAKTKQTHVKHMAHFKAVSVAIESVSFSTFQLMFGM